MEPRQHILAGWLQPSAQHGSDCSGTVHPLGLLLRVVHLLPDLGHLAEKLLVRLLLLVELLHEPAPAKGLVSVGQRGGGVGTVSYTHLTLPTIYSV